MDTRKMLNPRVKYWLKTPHKHNNITRPDCCFIGRTAQAHIWKWAAGASEMPCSDWIVDLTWPVSPLVVASADWSADLVRFKLIILISRRWSRVKKKPKPNKNCGVWRGASFFQEPTTLAEGRMLENKRERLKTFLRKIDEKAIVRIKHFMKERWGNECG